MPDPAGAGEFPTVAASHRVAGILLAAGAGSRMGTPKALLPWYDRLLVEHGIRLLRESGMTPTVVVLGAAASEVQASADLTGSDIVIADDWRSGMGASLRAGLTRVDALGAEAAIVTLVDQPLIGAEAITRLLAAFHTGSTVAVATYEGERRNPVLIARRHWADLLPTLTGDTGAKPWMRANPELITEVACDGTGSPDDVDTPADLTRIGPGE